MDEDDKQMIAAAVAGGPGEPAASPQKSPIIRSARACTVCRTAKMRCIGGDDGAQACQRCKRQNLECIFEKHRRGRKPGSKLSEHSKMLRRLERELKANKAKDGTTTNGAQSQSATAAPPRQGLQPPPIQTSYKPQQKEAMSGPPEPPPHPLSASLTSGSSGMGSTPTQQFDVPFTVTYPSSETRDTERAPTETTPDADDNIYPAQVVDRESQRFSTFFRTILNPPESTESGFSADRQKRERDHSQALPMPPHPIVLDPNVQDPIAAGLLDEQEAKVLFDLVFLRLNGFINLFDPRLHTVPYVRSRSPFLFSCLIMAGSKFWKAELYRQCQQIAHSFAYKAFAEGWRSVEVVQAFACLTYWKEPDDTRTWTYIGYACRMAVELGLNTYCERPPDGETEDHKKERRNRERTYLVLFVHDRALSMQTGRQWMLPEDDLVRHAKTWHDDNPLRPEDVIVAGMVNLRQIAAETTDVYRLQKQGHDEHYSDVNHEILLRGCNSKLTAWMNLWNGELKRAGAVPFHYSFLTFFRLHVRLFLNSLGLQSSLGPLGRTSPSLQALSICYSSAVQSLEIITREFAPWGLLRYGQDSMTIMSAYSAVFLLKLLRRTNMLSELNERASQDIHDLITQTANVYQEAALLAVSSSSAAYHARFLRVLVAKDVESKNIPAPRTSVSSSRGSPHEMDEDRPQLPPYAPMGSLVPAMGTAAPSYQPYSTVPPPLPPPLHIPQGQRMSPVELKPTPYRSHPPTPSSAEPQYQHFSSMEYSQNSHPRQPSQMVVPYPPPVLHHPGQAMPSELDARYSRTLLQELGFTAIGIDPIHEWFTQAMGPSASVGML